MKLENIVKNAELIVFCEMGILKVQQKVFGGIRRVGREKDEGNIVAKKN